MYFSKTFAFVLAACFGNSWSQLSEDFFRACKTGDDAYFNSCLIAKDLVTATDASNKTCLLIATEQQQCSIVERLVQHVSCDESARLPNNGATALMIAVEKGSDRCFSALTTYRPRFVDQRNDGMTALHLAAMFNRVEMAPRLGMADAQVRETINKEGMTPLILAAMSRANNIATQLINHGAKVVAADSLGRTALHYAAGNGDLDLMQKLIRKGAPVNSQTTDTPLLMAIKENRTEAALFLLNKDADAKAIDRKLGKSAIFLALDQLNTRIIVSLINNGANQFAKGERGATPLILAASKGLCGVMKLLADRISVKDLNERTTDDGENALFMAIDNNHVECAQDLLEKKVNVNFVRKRDGFTPLHAAVFTKNREMLLMLLSHGANANLLDRKGQTALSLALNFCLKPLVDILVDKTTQHLDNPNNENRLKSPPMAMAAFCNFPDTIKRLAEKGANVHGTDSRLFQPLHVACESGKSEAAMALIESGASINSELDKKHLWKTPLALCARSNLFDVVRVMLQRGAPAQSRYDQTSPLLYAISNNSTESAILLLDEGAKTTATWVDGSPFEAGDTALHLAVKLGNKRLVEKLLGLGANANAKNVQNKTPLDVATNGVEELLKQYQ